MPDSLQKQFQKIQAPSAKRLDRLGAKKERRDLMRNLGREPWLVGQSQFPQLDLIPERTR